MPITRKVQDGAHEVDYAAGEDAEAVCKHCGARLIEDEDGEYVSVDGTSCCEISGHDALRK